MGKTYLKVASVYFTIGVLAGLIMGIIHDFRFTSVHAHVNLLGWVTMALFGIIYHFYPNAANSKLAKTQFWLHNIGVPVMLGGIALQILGVSAALLPTIIGSLAVVIGVILFMVNVFKYVGKDSNYDSDKNVSL
ncbi:cbb3-type cytochrome c oxidase subunit I [Neobacillus niacini]|uniref:cbb3-type cytochrome c oxidase subunit I n=1 Tax=Neobacillus niacini TaxID=86668 RepID=UPI0007ABFE7C|nr:cbb3-type cytochrome c oxidase subunit I [Neobacillus niacini]MEC1523425.1 cbb3-type cytochrome c oxidase subunit I [Neobacillus niacini]